MRLKESRVAYLAERIVYELVKSRCIECDDLKECIAGVKQRIIEDLMVEDRLDEEVRNLLRQHQTELDRKRIEFVNMFRIIKDKLAKERNLIL